MALIEAVAAVLTKYMTLWPREVTNVVLETYTCTDDPWIPNVTGSATNCANSCNGMRVCVNVSIELRRAGQMRTSS